MTTQIIISQFNCYYFHAFDTFSFQIFIKIGFSAFQQKTMKLLLEIDRKIDNMSQSFEVVSLPRVNTKLEFNQLSERLKDEKEKTKMVKIHYIIIVAAVATILINSFFLFLFATPVIFAILVAMNLVKVKM